MASVRHLEFAKFRFFSSKLHPRNRNMRQCTKFDGNRIIYGWVVEIKLFSKWRPSAILSFRKLSFWSRDLYLCVILYLLSKFRINRPIRRQDIAKKDFKYPPSWICYDVIILHQKTALYVPNFVLNFHDIELRIFWNTLYFMFQHFGLKCSISSLILTILGDK